MSETESSLELIAAIYPNTFEAKARMNDLAKAANAGTIELVDGAVMVRQVSGNLLISDRASLTPKSGAKRGALIGAVIGVILPPTVLASAALGAAAGAIAGGVAGRPLADEMLETLGEELATGRSALLAVFDPEWRDQVVETIGGYDRMITWTIDPAGIERPEA